MASQVNVKFVVVLVVGVMVLLGGMLIAYTTFIRKSGEDYIRLGDQLMAEGNPSQAEVNYGMAYGHDRSRADWLEKWIVALEAWTPETRTEYTSAYRQKYVPVLHSLTQVKGGGTDVDAHDRYLGLLRDQSLHSRYSRSSADDLILQAENAFRYFEYMPSDQTDWHRLRRYRGLAVSRIISEGGTLDEGVRDRALDDLTSVLEVVPSDSDSLRGILSIRLREAFDFRVAGDFDRGQNALDTATREVNEFIADSPTVADAHLARLTIEVEQMRHTLMRESAQSGQAARITDTTRFRPALDQIAGLIERDPAAVGADRLIARFRVMESSLDPEANLRRSERLARLVVGSRDSEASSLMMLARLLEAQGKFDDQIEALRGIQSIRPRPLSLGGMLQYSYQESALGDEAIAYLTKRVAIGDAEEFDSDRAEALSKAEDARRRFAQIVPEGNARLLMIDGMIALANDDLPEALSLFEKFNSLTSSSDFNGLWREAQVAVQLGRNGVARDRLTTMRQMQPRNIPALLLLGLVETNLNNAEGAIDLFEEALEIDPTNAAALEGLRRARELTGEIQSENPIVDALIESRRLLEGTTETVGDPRASIGYLAGRIEELGNDPRIARELAGLYLGQNEMESARAVINRSAEAHPDDQNLQTVQEALLAENVIDARIRLYELSDAPEASRLIGIYSVYRVSGQEEEAAATLQRLVETAPEHPAVLELRLVEAFRAEDEEEAARVTETAQRTNADRAGGLTFLARLESFRGRGPEAVDILKQAIADGAADVGVYRLLARQFVQLGRYDDAVATYEQALGIRPDDLTSILEYLRSLITIGQAGVALDRARQMERYGRASTEFMDLWLRLEAVAGGPVGVQFAIDRRSQLLELDPGNRTNRIELARLYVIGKQFDLARPLLDSLRDEQDTLALVELDAQWHADQITVQVGDTARDGVEMARGVYVSYLLAQESGDVSEQIYISLARFMLQRGRRQIAIDALLEAREFQDPEKREADRMLASVYSAVNQWDEAYLLYKSILESGQDDESKSYQKRVVESLLRLGRYDEAESELEKIIDRAATDTTVRLQQAELANARGNSDDAIALLDKAVSENPTEPLVYIQRALLKSRIPELRGDVLTDLEQAIKLNPNDWRTLRVRAGFFYDEGRDAEAIDDLRAALRLNPSMDEVLLGLVLELIERDRDGEAQSIAEEVIERRQGDVQLSTQVAGLFAEQARWSRAVRFYTAAWERSGSEAVAAALIDAALRTEPMRIREARDVLTKLVENGADARENPKILGIRAIIDYAAGLTDDAEQRMIVAFEKSLLKIESDPGLLNSWNINCARMFEGRPDAELLAFMTRIAQTKAPGSPGRDWLELFVAQRQLAGEETRSEGLDALLNLSKTARTTHVPRLAYRVAGSAPYSNGDFARAEQIWTEGLEEFPEDWEMLNNVAYLISEKLGEPERALPLAIKAREATRGQNPQVLDTLGAVQVGLGELEEAKNTLLLALRLSRQIDTRLPLMVRLANIHLALDEVDPARDLLVSIRADASVGRSRLAQYQSDIDSLQSQIDSAGGP